jgi:hypothetical protein
MSDTTSVAALHTGVHPPPPEGFAAWALKRISHTIDLLQKHVRAGDRRLAPIVAVVLSVAGCRGGATPTSPTTTPSVVSPAGSWSGSISDAISGDGTMQSMLAELRTIS